MGTDVSDDMGGEDPSLRTGADGLAECGSGLDADPSARAGPSSIRSLPEEPPLNRRGCGPVFTSPGPAGINAPTPWIQATQQTYVSAVVGNVATSEPNSDDDHGRLLVRAATCTWKGKADDDLRPMIPIKNEALAAWLMGAIVLPSPLGFLACTHPWATRVAMLDYLETYLEGRLIAVVPLYVRMPPRIAETTLLLQLLERREGVLTDDSLVRELIKNAKRTSYDSLTRRLTFVLPDQAAAASWHSKMIIYRDARL
uniref:Uncharacterized protein n=1 Tax=Hyaloperonospora arabidopsidis (strain Emoy2) TaxID=559515 RepID=M4C496_HYAAE